MQWQPVLYRWSGSAWNVYANGHEFRAAANANGIAVNPGWTDLSNGRLTAAATFDYLPSGFYTVRNYYLWMSNNGRTSTWSWNRVGGTYCPL